MFPYITGPSDSNFIENELRNLMTNNTAKIQLKILGRTFRLISGAIVNAKKLTLCWVLSHDAKKRETETEPGEVLVSHVLNRWMWSLS